jgi:hypothetical protein
VARRNANPNRVKLHYSYTIGELAACFGVHKNTVRNWQRQGLKPIDDNRPILFHGGSVREFVMRRNKQRKQPCPVGTLYCLRCRVPRRPALDMVDYIPVKAGSGNLKAICEDCESFMYRRIRLADLARLMPHCVVQIVDPEPSLSGQTGPSLNCDIKRYG